MQYRHTWRTATASAPALRANNRLRNRKEAVAGGGRAFVPLHRSSSRMSDMTAFDPRNAGSMSEVSEDHRLLISQRMRETGPGSQSGTWVAAGAINYAGTVTANEVTFTVK